MSDFSIDQKVYFDLPGTGMRGTIEGFYQADVMLAKVKCNINPGVLNIFKYYYIPVSDLRTKY